MKLNKNALLFAAAAALGASVWAAGGHDQHDQHVAGAATPATALTAGEVRKVDTAQGKVTIRHEPIANLDMPAMTMVFTASKPELLKDLKAGDKIRFRAESNAGTLVVTQVEAAN